MSVVIGWVAKILDIFFPPTERALRARSVSYEQLAAAVSPILLAYTDPPAISLLPYRSHLVQAVITEAKFHDAHHAQNVLGRILAEYLGTRLTERPALNSANDAVVLLPVPLSRARVRERGYNQAERICQAACQYLTVQSKTDAEVAGIAFCVDATLLERIRDTQPQTQLGGRARRTNLQGAFQTARPADAYTLYIVVDDVVTTGATLSTTITTLQAAGAANILPIALAHSP